MSFNVGLAVIPIIFGWIALKNKSAIVKIPAGLVWFFFIPNTIYLVTDFINLARDVRFISGIYLTIDIAIYLVLIPIGIITYIVSVFPFEKWFVKNRHVDKNLAVFILNLFIGFGLVLGRILRANSWEVITNFQSVVAKSIEIVKSAELILAVFGFAILCQAIYIIFKKPISKSLKLK